MPQSFNTPKAMIIQPFQKPSSNPHPITFFVPLHAPPSTETTPSRLLHLSLFNGDKDKLTLFPPTTLNQQHLCGSLTTATCEPEGKITVDPVTEHYLGVRYLTPSSYEDYLFPDHNDPKRSMFKVEKMGQQIQNTFFDIIHSRSLNSP